ncbi:MAG: MFS transporter [Candidatus Bathyarchaeia archaeon]
MRSTYYGWVVASGCFCLTLLLGVTQSFGVFLDPLIREFGSSNTLTSGIYSTYWMFWSISVLWMGALSDRISPRLVLGFSAFFVGLGIALSSFVSAVWQLYITFGAITGFGAGGLWVPSSNMTMRWFKPGNSLNWAMSLVALGVGIGTTFLAPVEGSAITILGWRTAFGIVALVAWGIAAVSMALIKNPPVLIVDQGLKSASSRSGSIDRIKNLFFISLLISYFLGGGWVRQDVTVHIVSYLDTQKLAYGLAVFSLSIAGVGSISGRLLSGVLGEKVDDEILLSSYFVLQAISISILMISNNLLLVYFSSFLFGVAWGGAVPQLPIILRKRFGTFHFGVILGILSIGTGVGSVLGPVFGGYAFDVTQSYFLPLLVDVVLSIFAAAILLAVCARTTIGLPTKAMS